MSQSRLTMSQNVLADHVSTMVDQPCVDNGRPQSTMGRPWSVVYRHWVDHGRPWDNACVWPCIVNGSTRGSASRVDGRRWSEYDSTMVDRSTMDRPSCFLSRTADTHTPKRNGVTHNSSVQAHRSTKTTRRRGVHRATTCGCRRSSHICGTYARARSMNLGRADNTARATVPCSRRVRAHPYVHTLPVTRACGHSRHRASYMYFRRADTATDAHAPRT